MMFVGTRGQTLPWNEKSHGLLEELKIPHVYKLIEDVGHQGVRCYELPGAEILRFHWNAFGRRQAATDAGAG